MTSLTKQQQLDVIKDIFGLTKSLLDESERAVVILAGARLDIDLEKLLKHILTPYPGGTDPLFDGDRMLGTFSAKIAMAYRIGAIDADLERGLQIVRKIRNDFAHQLEHESLSSPRQKSRLAELVRWASQAELYQLGNKAFSEANKKSAEHFDFVLCTVCMAVTLSSGVAHLSRVNVGTPLSLT